MDFRFFRLLVAVLCLAGLLSGQTDEQAAESRRARQLMAAGRYADAAAAYERLLQALPGNAGIRLNLAMALHFAGRDGAAIPHFEAVLKLQPQTVPALMLMGASHMRMGQPGKAAPVLERAVALAPGDVEGRSMLVDALLMQERYQAALPHLRALSAAQPDNPRAWFGLGKAHEAVAQEAFAALEKAGPDSPWWLYLAAEVRLKMGRNTAAFALFRAALDKQPAFRGAHASLAEVYRKTGHPEWAAVEEESERKLGPPACATPTAECHFLNRRFQSALAVALRGRTPEALFWQSRAANQLAAEAFTRLAQLPPSAESHQVMAELHRSQGRYAEAAGEWRAALELAPGDPRLRQELAVTVYTGRDYPAAEKLVRELLALDAGVPELHFILGDCLMGQQRPEDAIPVLEKALSLQPDYPAAQAVLGRALLQTGEARRAIPHLRAGLAVDTDGSAYVQLSRAYRAAGDEKMAAELILQYQQTRKLLASEGVSITPPGR